MTRPEEAADRTFDLLVVGGGIFGCGAAREAALNGWSVCLCEREDLAFETSSRSSKLIHGGLRYLEGFETGLVRQSLRERAVLQRLAPNLVRPLPFLVPVREGARVGPWKLRAGLALYDLLARAAPGVRRKWLTGDEAVRAEPALDPAGLRGAGRYFDFQAFDSRLVSAIARAAVERGAAVLTRADVVELAGGPPDEFTATVQPRDGAGSAFRVKARAVLATVGPFSDRFRAKVARAADRRVRLTSGAHVVLPKVLGTHALTLTARSDGRVFFLLPFFGRTLAGTTDRDFDGDPEDPATDEKDVEWLLAEANAALGGRPFGRADVIASFTGLRALARDGATHPSKTSREQNVFEQPKGCVHVIGGKLTTWRLIARELVERAAPWVGKALDDGTASRTTPLPGTEVLDANRVAALAREFGADHQAVAALAARFGEDGRAILELARSGEATLEPTGTTLPESGAVLVHLARTELAQTAEDALRRRLPRLLTDRVAHGDLAKADAVMAAARRGPPGSAG
jgi:glycerol-3-phosphate dehydrogenase